MTIRLHPKDDDGNFEILAERGRTTRVLPIEWGEAVDLMKQLSDFVEPQDRHHTISELYFYRMLYNAHAFNSWVRHGSYPVVKSRYHSDGERCFGGGYFIVVATLSTGQVSNHYKDEHWDLFDVPEVDLAPEWDGHTPAVAAERLLEELQRNIGQSWYTR